MSEEPKLFFTYTPEQNVAYDELDKHGDLTAEQIRQRIGLLPVADVIEVGQVSDKAVASAQKATTKHRKPHHLSWRGQLNADEAPEHIRKKLR